MGFRDGSWLLDFDAGNGLTAAGYAGVRVSQRYGAGGYQYTYGNFNVTVEGGGTQTVALLAPNAVTILDFSGAPGLDNILDIPFVDQGGQNFNWVVSGIEISTGALPAAISPLLADEAAPALGGGSTISDATLAKTSPRRYSLFVSASRSRAKYSRGVR